MLAHPLHRKACDRSHGVSNLKILLHNPTAPGTGIIVMQRVALCADWSAVLGRDGIAAPLVRFAARRVREGENLPDKLPAQ